MNKEYIKGKQKVFKMVKIEKNNEINDVVGEECVGGCIKDENGKLLWRKRT